MRPRSQMFNSDVAGLIVARGIVPSFPSRFPDPMSNSYNKLLKMLWAGTPVKRVERPG